ncbi:MAG: hypothetical protein HOW73_20935 [Polyangiaceae bacterium]|nr:hypothetical protein [Polyangiaceae bacterium]
MKREKRLTKRERKALSPQPAQPQGHHHHGHIHCTACGKHLDEEMFDGNPAEAVFLQCDHKSEFPSCAACADRTREILAEHDRTGQPVKHAAAWH